MRSHTKIVVKAFEGGKVEGVRECEMLMLTAYPIIELKSTYWDIGWSGE
jgi:hypothetical protein